MMKHFLALLLAASLAGCATARPKITATSPATEVVEAEGMAPVVNSDLTGARESSLRDSMKNALGLVIGVYVSQEALVSKSLLIEDNISSQTEGYIERYEVLREWRDGEFYRTRIKALVRREDLAAKLKALELEPKRLGNPSVKIAVTEKIDGRPSEAAYAQQEIVKIFSEQGFRVSDAEPDIWITGEAESSDNPGAQLGGLVSCGATLSLKAVKAGTGEVIATASASMGGVGSNTAAAARSALANCARKASRDFSQSVLTTLRDRTPLQLTVTNVGSVNQLHELVNSVRALIDVRDCWVRSYANGIALVDADMKKGSSADLARRLEQLTSVKLKIKKTAAYNVEAELGEK